MISYNKAWSEGFWLLGYAISDFGSTAESLTGVSTTTFLEIDFLFCFYLIGILSVGCFSAEL